MTTATKEKVPAIYGALGEVMKGIANVPRNGKMKFGATEYSYLKADDVQKAINPLLTSNNIVVASSYTTHNFEKGSRWWVEVNLELRYYSTVDGSMFPPFAENPVMATGESIAGDDKSVNKALTQAIKNAHRATFQFESGEPEADDNIPTADLTKPTATERKIASAAKSPAKAPAKPAAKATTPREQIKAQFIDSGKKTAAEVNTLKTAVAKETGLGADELYAEILKRLESEG